MAERLVIKRLTPRPSFVQRTIDNIRGESQGGQKVLDEAVVQRPSRFSLLRRNRAGSNDKRAIKAAIESLRTSLSESSSQFVVVREKTRGRRTKVRLVRGWQRSADKALSGEVKKLKKEVRKSAVETAAAEHKNHAEEAKQLIKAGEREKVGRKAGAIAE